MLLAGAAHAETRWVAVVVGSNSGDGTQATLRYAERDAQKMARVLTDLGTVEPQDLVQLNAPTRAQLERSLSGLHARIDGWKQQALARVVLAFYFSGHSDGAALELGSDRLSWSDLRALLDGLNADVKLIIVDSCKSGTGLRAKGGLPSDEFPIQVVDRRALTGEVVITSSAANELAFESDELKGSYFTHHLVSALRGAADVSGDKRVTLSEAYRYAFERTVHATELLPSGAQHPSYEYRLAGEGELVITELRGAAVSLKLPGANRVLVFDVASGLPLVELTEGSAREIGLPPGDYSVRAIRWGESWAARFKVEGTTHRTLSWSDLSPVAKPKAASGRSERGMRAAPARPWLIRSR
jgi:uncharacterized caspase-like protein